MESSSRISALSRWRQRKPQRRQQHRPWGRSSGTGPGSLDALVQGGCKTVCPGESNLASHVLRITARLRRVRRISLTPGGPFVAEEKRRARKRKATRARSGTQTRPAGWSPCVSSTKAQARPRVGRDQPRKQKCPDTSGDSGGWSDSSDLTRQSARANRNSGCNYEFRITGRLRPPNTFRLGHEWPATGEEKITQISRSHSCPRRPANAWENLGKIVMSKLCTRHNPSAAV